VDRNELLKLEKKKGLQFQKSGISPVRSNNGDSGKLDGDVTMETGGQVSTTCM